MKIRLRKTNNRINALKAEMPGDLTEQEAHEIFMSLEPMLVHLLASMEINGNDSMRTGINLIEEAAIEQRLIMNHNASFANGRKNYSLAEIEAVINEVKQPIPLTDLEMGAPSCLAS